VCVCVCVCVSVCLSVQDGVGGVESARAANVVHELIAAVAMSGQKRLTASYALTRLNACGGGEWGAQWLLHCAPSDVVRDDLLRFMLAGIEATDAAHNANARPAWPASHYLALLARVDWRAAVTATPEANVDVHTQQNEFLSFVRDVAILGCIDRASCRCVGGDRCSLGFCQRCHHDMPHPFSTKRTFFFGHRERI
jgi:hypothetical protein